MGGSSTFPAMRNALRTLAFLVGLIPAIAAAQTAQFPQTLPPNTVVGRLGIGSGPAEAIPFSKFQSGIIGNLGAGTFYGNPGSGTAAITPFTLQGLSSIGTPDKTSDLLPIYDHTTGGLKSVQPSALLNAVCSVASSFLWNSAGTWVCQTAGQVAAQLGLPISMTLYSAGGTSNDTTGVQAAFTACAVSGCDLVCPIGVVYTVDTITVGSGTTVRSCNWKQRTQGTSILKLDGSSQIHVLGNRFTGNTATSGLTIQISGDYPISAVGSSYIWIRGNYYTKFGLYDIKFVNSNYVWVQDNHAFAVAWGTRLICTNNAILTGNIWEHTSLFTSTPTTNQFAVGPTLDTDPCGVSKYVTVSNNIIKDFPYSQGILVHSGQYVTIANNIVENASVCVSVNPFASTDGADHITITGNSCEANVSTTIPTDTQNGIALVAGAGVKPTFVTITGNVLNGFNRVFAGGGVNNGCILLDTTIDVTITGNSMNGCYANGISLIGNERNVVITGNSIDTITAVSTNSNGVQGLSGMTPTGIVASNSFNVMTTGVNIKGTATSMKYTSLNQCLGTTTCSSP